MSATWQTALHRLQHNREEASEGMAISVNINPGSGELADGNETNALFNIQQFVLDIGLEGVSIHRVSVLDKYGRFAFILRSGKYAELVHMPGIKLSKVRYMDEPGQNIWHFPRLYVDYDSGVWLFSMEMCRDEFNGLHDYEDEDEPPSKSTSETETTGEAFYRARSFTNELTPGCPECGVHLFECQHPRASYLWCKVCHYSDQELYML